MTIALETAELHGRPSCASCPPRMQRKRGCQKPGMNLERQASPVAFYSPTLIDGGERLMYECPTGHILREAPWVYEALAVASLVENSTAGDYSRLPRFTQQIAHVRSNELARIQRVKDEKRKAQRDAEHGRRTRSQGVGSRGARRG